MTLKEHASLVKMGFGLLDALLVACGFVLGYYLRFGWPPANIGRFVWLLLVYIPLMVFLLNHYELLVVDRETSVREVAFRLGKAFLITGVLLSGVIFVTQAKYYSRLLLAYSWAMGLSFVLLEKVILHYLTAKGVISLSRVRVAALVGQGERFRQAQDLLRGDLRYSLSSDAVFDASVPFDQFRQYLLAHAVDEVVFVLPPGRAEAGFDADRFMHLCESVGVPAKVFIGLDELFSYFSCSFTRLGDMPMLVFHPLHIDPDRAVVKRLMDLAGALVGLAVTGFVSPFIALAIKLDSSGPVFFSQERVGQNGRRFRMHKFRSMHEKAEEAQAGLAESNVMQGPIFKVADDPRATRVGRFLRRFSLDELPQFWNILKGEMSLVGTRPPTPDEVERYELWHYRRVSIRPGMTGLWQVSGRHDIRDFDEIARLDLRYIDEWSLWLDLKILARTLLTFARGQ